MECGNRLRVGVCVLKTLVCRGLRVGPSKVMDSGTDDGQRSLRSRVRDLLMAIGEHVCSSLPRLPCRPSRSRWTKDVQRNLRSRVRDLLMEIGDALRYSETVRAE